MKNITFLAAMVVVAVLALSVTACGQRVYPKEPEGKIQPSRSY